MNCEFCNKIFKNISTLNKHKKTAKYCLIKQNNFECTSCLKQFINEESLHLHYLSCLKKKDNYIITLEKENSLLKEKNIKLESEINSLTKENERYLKEHMEDKKYLQMLGTKPVINNNSTNTKNNINNTLHLGCLIEDEKKIKDKIDNNLNINYVCDGQKGLALFVVENLLKNSDGNLTYVCSDPSRHFFKYKNNEGEIVKDVKAKKLTNNLCKSDIISKAVNIANNWWTDEDGDTISDRFQAISSKALEIRQLNSDNSTFCTELSALTTK